MAPLQSLSQTALRARETLSRLGKLEGSLYLVARALEALSKGKIRLVRYYLVAQPTSGTQVASITHPPGSDVDFCPPDDPFLSVFPRPPSVITQRFQRGHACLRARSKGAFAGYLWLARGHYDEDEVRCCYVLDESDRSAWDYDIYVAPEYRIGRTFARLWQTANHHLAAEGVQWCFSRISAFNPDSLKAHSRLGATSLFSATFINIGPIQVTIAGHKPYLHLSFSNASAPLLRLRPPE